MATRTYLVPDDEMPAGFDWLRLDRDDGDLVILFRASCLQETPAPDSGNGWSQVLTRQHLDCDEGPLATPEQRRSTLRLVV